MQASYVITRTALSPYTPIVYQVLLESLRNSNQPRCFHCWAGKTGCMARYLPVILSVAEKLRSHSADDAPVTRDLVPTLVYTDLMEIFWPIFVMYSGGNGKQVNLLQLLLLIFVFHSIHTRVSQIYFTRQLSNLFTQSVHFSQVYFAHLFSFSISRLFYSFRPQKQLQRPVNHPRSGPNGAYAP